MIRPDWDETFMDTAELMRKRSTCLRRQVGAVVVKDNRMISASYNGTPPGFKHCDEAGCLREQLGVPSGERHEICRGLHAEMNAILQVAILGGQSIQGTTMYTTYLPCSICARLIASVGIARVVFGGGYPDEFAENILQTAGVKLHVYTQKVVGQALREGGIRDERTIAPAELEAGSTTRLHYTEG
jgi:dCMP deaminase